MQKSELLKPKNILVQQYESPIEIWTNDFMTNLENDIEKKVMKCIWKYDIKVDKNELIKALNYDRQQFEKGYDAGYQDGFEKGKEYYLKKIKSMLYGEEE